MGAYIEIVSYFYPIAKTILAINKQTWTLLSSQENIQPTYNFNAQLVFGVLNFLSLKINSLFYDMKHSSIEAK